MKFNKETYFFGYLNLKWRRLTRVLSFVFLFVILALVDPWALFDEGGVFVVIPTYFFMICLISWVMKPFIIKVED